MNIVLGASGQIGSAIVNVLLENKKPVKAIVRDPKKASYLKSKDINVEIADFFDRQALIKAFSDGQTVFLLTPEDPQYTDVINDTEVVLNNFREAISLSEIKKIVGLSSLGAQHATGTGNLKMSYLLEHAFKDLPVKQIFIRPGYYYSNWMAYFETAKEEGILPTFFPPELKIPMSAPTDVAKFIAHVITDATAHEGVYELVGKVYSSVEVANIFGQLLNREVIARQIPREQWEDTLQQFGFSESGIQNLIEMTTAVIEGRAQPEKEEMDWIRLPTSLKRYLEKV